MEMEIRDPRENDNPEENNIGNFKTGTKVTMKDPIFFDLTGETQNGFIAKQLDDRHFLVKLDEPFTKSDGKVWKTICRDYAHQIIEEK